jgi:hypothetical protein
VHSGSLVAGLNPDTVEKIEAHFLYPAGPYFSRTLPGFEKIKEEIRVFPHYLKKQDRPPITGLSKFLSIHIKEAKKKYIIDFKVHRNLICFTLLI